MDNKWAYDIEVMGGNFFSATFINVDTEEVKSFVIYGTRNQLPQLEQFLEQEIVLIGYNNIMYDGTVIQYLLQNKTSKTLLQDVADFSSELINSDRGYGNNYGFKRYQYPEKVNYKQIDLMKIIEVNGVVPSLKLAGIILHWHKVQDLPYDFKDKVETVEQAKEILKYNENDVRITLKLYKKILPQIELREKLSQLYNLDLMSCSDSKIGDKLLEKFYMEKTGVKNVYSLRDNVIEHEQFFLSDCMYDDIYFKTNYMKRIKNELSQTLVRKSNNYQVKKTIQFGGVEYQFASGGLHSVDTPALFKTDENFIIRDVDYNSFYPSMMIKNHIVPEHIGDAFIDILNDITKERIAAKKKDKVKAAGLKITINAIYGKLGFIGSWFRDNRAILKVTIPGQLYLLMLIERFVLAGIEVISANTDGIVCRIKREMEKEYLDIANSFSKEIGIGIEFTDYDIYARRDVNNYLSRKYDGEVKYKGCFTPEPEIKKGYMYPVVPQSVYKNILEGIPVEDTIRNHDNILNFCISKKMDSKFNAEFHLPENDEVEYLQKTNRFYISTDGGKLIKRNKETDKTMGLFVNQNVTILNDYDESIPVSEYHIDYDYYINEARSLVDDVKLYDKEFQPFVDEAEDFTPPANNKRREEFFYKFYMVKNMPEKFLDNMIWLEDNYTGDKDNFFQFLKFAEDNGKLSGKFEAMIKLNHFSQFGNQKNLLKFYEEFTKGMNKYQAKLSDKSKEKRLPLLQEFYNWMPQESFPTWEQIKNEVSVVGFPYSKYENICKMYVFVKEINMKSYNPIVKFQVLKTGEIKELKVKQDSYWEHQFKEGDIIRCKELKKQFKKKKDDDGKWITTDKFDWFVMSWYKMTEQDKFLEN